MNALLEPYREKIKEIRQLRVAMDQAYIEDQKAWKALDASGPGAFPFHEYLECKSRYHSAHLAWALAGRDLRIEVEALGNSEELLVALCKEFDGTMFFSRSR